MPIAFSAGATKAGAYEVLEKPLDRERLMVALRNALETVGRTVVTQGVLAYTKDNHWGYALDTGVMLKVVNGDWQVD